MSQPWEDFSGDNAADWESLRETPEKRKQNAANALGIMQSEQASGTHPDPAALQREMERTKAIAGGVQPHTQMFTGEPGIAEPVKVAHEQPPSEGNPWDDFKTEQTSTENAPWKDFAPSTQEVTASILPRTWAGFKEWFGGQLQRLGETNPDEVAAGIAAVSGGGGAAAQRYEQQKLEVGKTPEQLAGEAQQRAESPTAKKGAEIYATAKKEEEAATPEGMTWGQRIVSGAVVNTLQQLPAMATAVVTRNPLPAVLSAGAMQGSQTYGEARATGIEAGRASSHANIDAAAEMVFEYMPTKFLLDNLKGPILKTFTKYIIAEGVTEGLTTAVQSANAKLSTRPDMTLDDYMMDIVDTIAMTAVSAPMLGGAAKVMSPLSMRGQREPAPTEEIPLAKPEDNWVSQTNQGNVNPALTSPNFDFPTAQLDAAEHQQLDQQDAVLDPETITPERAQEAAKLVEDFQKKSQAPALPAAEMAWSQLAAAPASAVEDAAEFGASAKQSANAVNYVNPNSGDRLDRTITFSSADGYVGLTPRQVLPVPGTYTVGMANAEHPVEYLAGYQDTVEELRQEYMPDATIVISPERAWSNSALGWHYTTGPTQHMIVPAVLRLGNRALGEFSSNAQQSAFYNLTHEFGHALIEHSFFKDVSTEAVVALRDQARAGVVGQEVMAQLPEQQQAIVGEFNRLKQGVVDGTLNAQQFVEQWMGPAKIGRKTFLSELKVAPTAPAMDLVRAIAKRAADNSNIANEASRDALYRQGLKEFTSLEEYLAEQMARHAYTREWDQKSPLGKYMSRALDSLRKFFTDQKKSERIAPGTAFSEWVKGLSRTEQALRAKELAREAKKAAGKAAIARKAPKVKKAAVAAEKVKRTKVNVATDTRPARDAKARAMVTALVRQKAIETGDTQYKELMDSIKNDDFEEFIDQYQRLAGKTVKFEVDPDEVREMPLFITLKGESIGNALAPGHDAHGNLMNRMGLDNSIEVVKQQGWIYVDSGGKTPLLISGSDMYNRGQVAAAAKAFANRLGIKVEVAFDTERTIVNPDREKPDAMKDFRKEGFSGPNFKAWFGDWELNPTESSMARIGIVKTGPGYVTLDKERISPPLVIFANLAKLQQGQNHFHASTTLGQHYEDAMNPLAQGEEKGLVPVVLNIRNPYIVEPGQAHAPSRAELQAQGYDGILYLNDLDGDSSWIVFSPEQVKIVPTRSPYGGKQFMELDVDQSTPEGEGRARLQRGTKDFVVSAKAYRKFLRYADKSAVSLQQMQQLAWTNPEISELGYWSKSNLHYTLYKSSRQREADQLLGEFKTKGTQEQEQIHNFIMNEFEGRQHWFDLKRVMKTRIWEGQEQQVPWYTFAINERTLQEAQKLGIDVHSDEGRHTLEFIQKMKQNIHLDMLNEDELVMRRIYRLRYTNPAVYDAAKEGLAYNVHQLRLKPWIPQVRFGEHLMILEKKNDKGKWEVVHREGFDTVEKRDDAIARAKRALHSDERISAPAAITEKAMVMMSLPKDFLTDVATELDLTQAQMAQLSNILSPAGQDTVLKGYDAKRLGITGYSKDLQRIFADFSWHHSNLQAKILYRAQFRQAEGQLRDRIKAMEQQVDPESNRQKERLAAILQKMQNSTAYVMNPPNEYHLLRSIVTITYLALNVKTAVMNVTGLMTTELSAEARFGAYDGSRRFMRAISRAMNSVLPTKPGRTPLPPLLQKALDMALKQGALSQTYPYHLSGYVNRTVLPKGISKYSQQAVDIGMFPFRMVELFTRRVSFLMEVEAALEQNKGIDKTNELEQKQALAAAYDKALQRTNLTQNDYSLGNRLRFMQGKLALATIFGSFAQHLSWHSVGGYEIGERRLAHLEATITGEKYKGPKWYNSYTGRMMLLMFAIAGYEGLPFGANLLDFAEYFWRLSGHPKSIRQELREYVQSLGEDPIQWAHGLGSNVAGFDISRSFGMGHTLPGTDFIAKNSRAGVAEAVGNLALDAFGPLGSFIKWGLSSMADPGKGMRQAPGEIGNLYNAYQWSQYGVRGPNNGRLLRDENGLARDPTTWEIIQKALGGNPSEVSKAREMNFDRHDQKQFWINKRNDLIEEYHDAFNKKDNDGMAAARKKISEHNSWLTEDYPEFRDFRIRAGDLARNRQRWRKAEREEERGMLPGKKYRGLSEGINRSYEPPEASE